MQQIKARPGIGWVRANEAAESMAAPEIPRLKRQIEELQSRLEQARNLAPAGAERLAQGSQEYSINYTFDSRDKNDEEWEWSRSVAVSWDDIFSDVGPILINEASENQLRVAINRVAQVRSRASRAGDKEKNCRATQTCGIFAWPSMTIKRSKFSFVASV